VNEVRRKRRSRTTRLELKRTSSVSHVLALPRCTLLHVWQLFGCARDANHLEESLQAPIAAGLHSFIGSRNTERRRANDLDTRKGSGLGMENREGPQHKVRSQASFRRN